MSSILLVDDAVALGQLFSVAIEDRLGCSVEFVAAVAEVEIALRKGPYDLAVVDLSYPQENTTGIDVLVEIHAEHPTTLLAIITQGDRWVIDILRDAVDLLPIATVISKSAPLSYQLDMIDQLLSGHQVDVDPAIASVLRHDRHPLRSVDRFELLVPHAGHSKLWAALIDADHDVTYQDIVNATGLKMNTVKNYRAQLLPELRIHGLNDPSLRDMQQFAWRCKALLRPHVESAPNR